MGFGPLLEDKLCLIFKLAPSVCRMTFPILASLLVRLVVLLPFQLLRLSLATPSRWTPLALSVFLIANILKRAFSSQLAAKLRNRLLVLDRKSGSAGMPTPSSYAVFCLKKKICGQFARIELRYSRRGTRAAYRRRGRGSTARQR